MADACDTAALPGKHASEQALPRLAADSSQHAGRAQRAADRMLDGNGAGAEPAAGLKRLSGACDSPTAGALGHAELGRLQHAAGHGSEGSEAGSGAGAAPTYAQRLAREGGARLSRGNLAAALCKARQDILLSVFVTRPAIWSPLFNFLQASRQGARPAAAVAQGIGPAIMSEHADATHAACRYSAPAAQRGALLPLPAPHAHIARWHARFGLWPAGVDRNDDHGYSRASAL